MIKTYENSLVGEKVKVYKHKSGLEVYVCEKPEFSSSYAIFGTRYGSIDTKFSVNDNEVIEVPEGIAHYLEHKLFESEELDAFARFAKTGASANAFTSFDRTCYLFSCSTNFEENFKILLDFVQHPYFTEETVRKEQGIIGQEIQMYDDSAPWQMFMNLLGALYKKHPIRIDIAGTVESIAKINAELLYDCYNTFYNLNNMFICVAGNVDAQNIFDLCDELLITKEPVEIKRFMPDEDEKVEKQRVEVKLPVSKPIFGIGFKEKCEKPEITLKEKILSHIIIKCIFDNDSPLYKELFDSKLINDTFCAEYSHGYGYACTIVEGESDTPEKVREIVNRYLQNYLENGIDKKDIDRAVKAYYSDYVCSYNSAENIVMIMVKSAFSNTPVFEEFDIIKNISEADIKNRLKEMFKIENSSISIVNKE